jgi:SAM-dependent methyltransferase
VTRRPARAGSGREAAARLFDGAAGGYEADMARSLGRWGRDVGYYAEYKIRLLRKRFPGPVGSILEFGCGVGRNLPHLRGLFPESRLAACDPSRRSLALAESACPEASFFVCDDAGVGAHAGRYDLVLVAGVLHHVTDDASRRAAVRDVRRLLRDGGRAVVFEHNPRNPVVVRSLAGVPWDDGAVLLGPGDVGRLFARGGFRVRRMDYVLFFPSAVRFMDFLDPLLAACPLGAQHCVEAEKEGAA